MTQAAEAHAVDLNFEVNRLVGIRLYRHIKQVMRELDEREQQNSAKIGKVDHKIE